MSSFFFLCEPESVLKDSKRYYVRVSAKDQQDNTRDLLSAKQWAKTLFNRAIEGGSIQIDREYKITTQIESAKVPANLSVVFTFEPLGSVSVLP